MANSKLLAKFYRKTAKALLVDENVNCLLSAKHGLERESLRIDAKGQISRKNHPLALGSSLMHPVIKTDFAESQLEYATSPHKKIEDTLSELTELHSYTIKKLDGETLWPFSMPSPLPSEDRIPLGQFGSSAEGKKKNIYRRGLGFRYGRKMQTISGVHYNLSFDRCLLSAISHFRYKKALDIDTQSEIYFDTIRNFNRISPALLYLFGSSSLLDESFTKSSSKLKPYAKNTLNAPFATSLRLSDIGYTSSVQAKLPISINSLQEYVEGMRKAVSKTYTGYRAFSKESENQLNDHYLQLENEYYSLIRPKQIPLPGERVTEALMNRGIEYIEIRLLDIDPFSPIGVEENRLYFLHMFLLYCLLAESSKADSKEMKVWHKNQKAVTWKGRDLKTKINFLGEEWQLTDFVYQLLVELQEFADILDCNNGENGKYTLAWENQWEKWNDPSLLASSISELGLKINKMSFLEFGLSLSRSHSKFLLDLPLTKDRMEYYEDLAEKSLFEQRKLEIIEGSRDV